MAEAWQRAARCRLRAELQQAEKGVRRVSATSTGRADTANTGTL